MSALEPVLTVEARLGESPRWSVRENVLYWVDILAPSLNRFDPATGENRAIATDEEIGCIAERTNGGFIAGMRSGIWLLTRNGTKERLVGSPHEDCTKSRFNDGRADPWGGFWAGTMWEPRDRPGGVLWRAGPSGKIERLAGDVTTSNGVAFSPDRRWAYHSDSRASVIFRYPLDPDTGSIAGEREVFKRFREGEGRPDGAAVDAEGCYWSALYAGGRVVRLSPDGEEIASYPLPACCPTMPAFGGADLRTLYVTTARENRSVEELARLPLSGSLFAMPVDVPGLPEPEYQG